MPWIDTIKKISWKKSIIVVLFVCIILAVGLLILEGMVRLLPMGNVIDRPHESLNYYEEVPERVIDIRPNVKDGEISFYGESFPFWSNELGCFDEPYKDEKPFVYLAGDSLSWGYTSFEDKWGTQLEKVIDTRILKCAVSASGSRHQYLKAKEILTAHPHPKLILVGYFSQNDALDDYYFPQFVYRGGERVDNPTPGKVPTEEEYKALDEKLYFHQTYCTTGAPAHPFFQRIKCFLYNHSALYVLVTKGIKSVLGMEIHKDGSVFPPPPEEAFETHFAAIKDLEKLAFDQGALLVFVMIPSREEVYPEIYGEVASSTKNRVKNFFTTEGILHVDLEPVFKDIAKQRKELNPKTAGDLYWPIEWHLNVLGNHAVAYGTARYLYEKGIFSQNEDSYKRLEVLKRQLYAE
jgi:hypothetical protein